MIYIRFSNNTSLFDMGDSFDRDYSHLVSNIRIAITNRFHSIKDFSLKTGISQSVLSQFFHGKDCKFSTLYKILYELKYV